MAEEPSSAVFRRASVTPLGMAGAIVRAREEIAVLSKHPIDAITRTERSADGGWIIVLDLVESVARMGDNDMLLTYELELDTSGDVTRMERTARYRREQGR